MPQYVLTEHNTLAGVILCRGTILSTDVPPTSMFYIAPDEAERLEGEGRLMPHTPEVLTGARSHEPGWRTLEQHGAWSDGENPW